MKKLVLLTMAVVLAASTIGVAGVHIVGGPSDSKNVIPFWAQMPGMRWQTIWHKSDINEAGAIAKIEFQASGIPTTSSYTDCAVLLCHTTLSHVTNSYKGNYGGKTPVTVFSGTKVVPATAQGQWFTVVTVTPTKFKYNNSDNLLIEISWSSGSPSVGCYCSINLRGKGGRVYTYNPIAEYGNVTYNLDQLARITIGYPGVEATSLGRVKTLFR